MALTNGARAATARLLCLAMFLAAGAAACRTDEPSRSEAADAASAECPVCKAEGDLACLNVKVRADTPRSQYQGATYFFCSEQCKEEFDRRPGKYLGR